MCWWNFSVPYCHSVKPISKTTNRFFWKWHIVHNIRTPFILLNICNIKDLLKLYVPSRDRVKIFAQRVPKESFMSGNRMETYWKREKEIQQHSIIHSFHCGTKNIEKSLTYEIFVIFSKVLQLFLHFSFKLHNSGLLFTFLPFFRTALYTNPQLR